MNKWYAWGQSLKSKKAERTFDQSYIGHLLPWLGVLDTGVVLTKAMVLQKTIAFQGKDYLVVDGTETQYDIHRLNELLVRLPDGWGLQVDIIRKESVSPPLGTSPYLAADLMQRERERLYQQYPHYATQNYLTFYYALTGEQHTWKERLLRTGGQESILNRTHSREFDQFVAQVSDIIGLLSRIFDYTHALDAEETLAFLHNTISPIQYSRIHTPSDLFGINNILPDADILINPLALSTDTSNLFLLPLSIYDYPRQTYPLIFEALHKLAVGYRMSHRYIVYDQQTAEKVVRGKKLSWFRKKQLNPNAPPQSDDFMDTVSMGKMDEADVALEELADNQLSFGVHTGTLLLQHTDYEELLASLEEVKKVFSAQSTVVRVENIAALDVFLGSLPGNVHAGVRREIISTQNLVDMLPIHADWRGNMSNHHLQNLVGTGEPQFICSTQGGSAFRFHLNVGDVGHTLVCGPTGAGKSVLLAFLAATWLKYPHAQVVIFDKDRSAEGITKALDGDFFALGEEGGLVLQPLSVLTRYTTADTHFVVEFVQTIFSIRNIELTHERIDDIRTAVESLLTSTSDFFTLANLVTYLQDVDLKATLQQYAAHWQNFLGGEGNFHMEKSVTTFEMNAVLEKGIELVLPTLLYLFYEVERRFDGRPTLLVLDEAWLFLKHPVFAERLQNWLKTLRKKHVYVILATQEISDFTNASIKDTILNAVATRIFLPNPRARDVVVAQEYQKVGLSEEEILLLSELMPKQHYYFTNTQGHMAIDLDLGEVALSLLTKKSSGYDVATHCQEVLQDAPKWAQLHAIHYGKKEEVTEVEV